MSSIFKSFHQKKLGELVKWICYPDRFLDRNEPLLYILFNAQAEIKGMDFYLTEGESEIANEILAVYKDCLAEDYLRGRLKADKTISRMTGQEYFMFTLASFLQENECNIYFRREKLNIERLMYECVESIRSPGGSRDSATVYRLNNFSKVYQKMYYISEYYYELCPLINKTVSHRFSEKIKETIHSGTITFLKYSL